jgi:pSer/pThr/pTyr-binding forkhead associated (FHA) protein
MFWGKKNGRRNQNPRLADGEASPVNEDQRFIEPFGHNAPWGQIEQIDGKYGTLPVMLTRQIILIGRHIGCDILLNDERASRYHVIITWEKTGCTIRDNGSTNGTLLNNLPLKGTVAIKHGDIIEAGGEKFQFSYTEVSGLISIDSQPTDAFALQNQLNAMEQRPTFMAEIAAMTGPEPGRTWPIRNGVSAIGRGNDNQVILPHASVSRHHAQLVVQPDGVFIHDVGSSNGTTINGEILRAPYRLSNGDRIQIGDILLIYHQEQTQASIQPQSSVSSGLSPSDSSSAVADPFLPRRGTMTRPNARPPSMPSEPYHQIDTPEGSIPGSSASQFRPPMVPPQPPVPGSPMRSYPSYPPSVGPSTQPSKVGPVGPMIPNPYNSSLGSSPHYPSAPPSPPPFTGAQPPFAPPSPVNQQDSSIYNLPPMGPGTPLFGGPPSDNDDSDNGSNKQ